MMTKKTEKIHRINRVKVGFGDKKITSYGAVAKQSKKRAGSDFFVKIR